MGICKPFLSNGSVNTLPRRCNDTTARVGSRHVTCVFYGRGPCRGVILNIFGATTLTRVEAGSNTSTVTLRVVGGDEKGILRSKTVKYGHEFQAIRTRERLRSIYKRQTRPLVRESAPQKQDRNCQTVINIWS
jgi:hypothetical protein